MKTKMTTLVAIIAVLMMLTVPFAVTLSNGETDSTPINSDSTVLPNGELTEIEKAVAEAFDWYTPELGEIASVLKDAEIIEYITGIAGANTEFVISMISLFAELKDFSRNVSIVTLSDCEAYNEEITNKVIKNGEKFTFIDEVSFAKDGKLTFEAGSEFILTGNFVIKANTTCTIVLKEGTSVVFGYTEGGEAIKMIIPTGVTYCFKSDSEVADAPVLTSMLAVGEEGVLLDYSLDLLGTLIVDDNTVISGSTIPELTLTVNVTGGVISSLYDLFANAESSMDNFLADGGKLTVDFNLMFSSVEHKDDNFTLKDSSLKFNFTMEDEKHTMKGDASSTIFIDGKSQTKFTSNLDATIVTSGKAPILSLKAESKLDAFEVGDVKVGKYEAKTECSLNESLVLDAYSRSTFDGMTIKGEGNSVSIGKISSNAVAKANFIEIVSGDFKSLEITANTTFDSLDCSIGGKHVFGINGLVNDFSLKQESDNILLKDSLSLKSLSVEVNVDDKDEKIAAKYTANNIYTTFVASINAKEVKEYISNPTKLPAMSFDGDIGFDSMKIAFKNKSVDASFEVKDFLICHKGSIAKDEKTGENVLTFNPEMNTGFVGKFTHLDGDKCTADFDLTLKDEMKFTANADDLLTFVISGGDVPTMKIIDKFTINGNALYKNPEGYVYGKGEIKNFYITTEIDSEANANGTVYAASFMIGADSFMIDGARDFYHAYTDMKGFEFTIGTRDLTVEDLMALAIAIQSDDIENIYSCVVKMYDGTKPIVKFDSLDIKISTSKLKELNVTMKNFKITIDLENYKAIVGKIDDQSNSVHVEAKPYITAYESIVFDANNYTITAVRDGEEKFEADNVSAKLNFVKDNSGSVEMKKANLSFILPEDDEDLGRVFVNSGEYTFNNIAVDDSLGTDVTFKSGTKVNFRNAFVFGYFGDDVNWTHVEFENGVNATGTLKVLANPYTTVVSNIASNTFDYSFYNDNMGAAAEYLDSCYLVLSFDGSPAKLTPVQAFATNMEAREGGTWINYTVDENGNGVFTDKVGQFFPKVNGKEYTFTYDGGTPEKHKFGASFELKRLPALQDEFAFGWFIDGVFFNEEEIFFQPAMNVVAYPVYGDIADETQQGFSSKLNATSISAESMQEYFNSGAEFVEIALSTGDKGSVWIKLNKETVTDESEEGTGEILGVSVFADRISKEKAEKVDYLKAAYNNGYKNIVSVRTYADFPDREIAVIPSTMSEYDRAAIQFTYIPEGNEDMTRCVPVIIDQYGRGAPCEDYEITPGLTNDGSWMVTIYTDDLCADYGISFFEPYTPSGGSSDNTLMIVLVVVIAVLIVAVAGFAIYKKNNA